MARVPEPPSVRGFYAFEGHVEAGFKARGSKIPDACYEAPVFYFSNPAAIYGPWADIRRPEGCEMLDFELEIAAVIDGQGQIAGFTLMNDWSARDIQRREMTVGLGPSKGKDFATSLGPWLVTPDELPYDGEWLDLEATASINNRPVARSQSEAMQYSWPELVAQAARGTRLRPGDVLGSGTLTGGGPLETGPIAAAQPPARGGGGAPSPGGAAPPTPFRWQDGERLIVFGHPPSVDLLGGPGYSLLTTDRGAALLPETLEGAGGIHIVAAGRVDE